MPPPSTALVTGATSGIGAGFTRQLARAGHRLVLVARDVGRLDAAAVDLLAEGAPGVEVLPADLANPADRAAVIRRLEDDEAPIDLLINNAGIGLGRSFAEVTDDELLRQLEVNVTAVLLLSKAVLPGMRRRNRGSIVNVASVAALFPNPGATYAGSKAWVVAFTEGLALNLRGTDVTVQALCPGLTRTEFHQRAGIATDRIPKFSFMDVDAVVSKSLSDLDRGRVVSVPGVLNKAMVGLTKILPRSLDRALAVRVYAARGE